MKATDSQLSLYPFTPSNPVHETIYKLNVGAAPNLDELREAMRLLLDMPNSDVRNVQLGCLLTGMMVKGPTVEELEVLIKALFSHDSLSPYNEKKFRVELPEGRNLIGAVGSGKKGVKTINVSTAAMLTASSLGVYTAKPGSSSVSSMTGSADLVRTVGARIDMPLKDMAAITGEVGFGMFAIERYLKKFGELYNNRLYTPHVLSFGLAALGSPVRVDKLLYGLSHPNVDLSLHLFKRFGYRDTMVTTCTHDGVHYIDEVGVYGETKLVGMKNGVPGPVRDFKPLEELGLPAYTTADIAAGTTHVENVRLVVETLSGKGRTALEDIVAINASTLLFIDGQVQDLPAGFHKAKEALKDGAPYEKLLSFVSATDGKIAQLESYR